MAARPRLPRVDALRLALLVGLAITVLHALDALGLGGREVPLVSRLEHAAKDMRLHPPEPGWDGVYEMKGK